MTLTKERVEKFTGFLTDNEDLVPKLLEATPEEAVKQINAQGHDFTVAELHEFKDAWLATAKGDGELNESALDNVSGGLVSAWNFGVSVGNAINARRNPPIPPMPTLSW